MRSKVFRARYRVKNAVGWSDYSPILYRRAASVPSAPPLAPSLVQATSTTLELSLTKSTDNGGAVIIAHELWIDDGELGAYTQVASYDGISTSFTID